MNRAERLLFAAAAEDERMATWIDRVGMWVVEPEALTTAMPRAVAVNVRRPLSRRGAARSSAGTAASN